MASRPIVEFYHIKAVVHTGPMGSGESFIKAEATPMPATRDSLTEKKYQDMSMAGFVYHYDVVFDNEEKIVWVWLPVAPRGLLISTERVREKMEESEFLSLGFIAELVKKDDLDGQAELLTDYESSIIYKGEEPDKFWNTLGKVPSTTTPTPTSIPTPQIPEAPLPVMGEKKTAGFRRRALLLSLYFFAAGSLSANGYSWPILGILVTAFFWWAVFFILHWYGYREERSVGAAVTEILIAFVMQAIPFAIAKFKGWGLGLGLDYALFPLMWVRPYPIIWTAIFHTIIVVVITWWYVPKRHPKILESV